MYESVTRNIHVIVRPKYLQSQSRPDDDHFVWAYTITIENRGIEIVTRVNGIPKGSRLAVSTNLLACIITVCMRATSQIRKLTGGLAENDFPKNWG